MNTENKTITWAELKSIVDAMTPELLNAPVIGWPITETDGESGVRIREVMILEEDYHFDGDEGCMPKSVMDEDQLNDLDEYYLIYEKGTPILIYQ